MIVILSELRSPNRRLILLVTSFRFVLSDILTVSSLCLKDAFVADRFYIAINRSSVNNTLGSTSSVLYLSQIGYHSYQKLG